MKYGGNVVENKTEDWESFLFSANNDFISVIILWYSRVSVGSTYAWLFAHTIEKYLKSYLLKVTPEINPKEYNHGVNKLWKDFNTKRGIELTTKPKLNEAFNEIIKDVTSIRTSQRYTGNIDFASSSFFYYYITLCSYIRYLIIGKKEYRSTLYGLPHHNFLPIKYIHEKDVHGKVIVEKVLHLCLDHAISTNYFGEFIQQDFKNCSISNTSLLIKKEACPICYNNGKFDLKKIINYYNTIDTSSDI